MKYVVLFVVVAVIAIIVLPWDNHYREFDTPGGMHCVKTYRALSCVRGVQ